MDSLDIRLRKITRQKHYEEEEIKRQRFIASSGYFGDLATQIGGNLEGYLDNFEKGDTSIVAEVTDKQAKFRHPFKGDNPLCPLPSNVTPEMASGYAARYGPTYYPLMNDRYPDWTLKVDKGPPESPVRISVAKYQPAATCAIS